MNEVRGIGRALLAAVLLTIGGVLNIFYGIAAIGNSKFFVHDTHYVFWIIHGLTIAGGSNDTWEDHPSAGPTMAPQTPRPPR